jgi:hypothetical protein
VSDHLVEGIAVDYAGNISPEADYIADAAEKHPAEINARLPADFVAQQRTLLGTVRGAINTQAGDTATVGELTDSQNDAMTTLNDRVANGRESAKRAFKSQDVRLRNAFQVGINSAGGYGERVATLPDHPRVLSGCRECGGTCGQRLVGSGYDRAQQRH